MPMFQPSVSGAVVADFPALMALAAPADGDTAIVASAVVPGGTPRTRWVYLSGVWRLDGPQDLLVDIVPAFGVAGTGEQTLRSYAMPAGLMRSMRYLRLSFILHKSGTTDSCTARIRANGALFLQDTGLAVANRQRGIDSYFFASSDTELRYIFNGAAGLGGATSTSAGYPANTSVISMIDNGLTLALSMQMSGSTDTPSIPHILIRGG